MNWAQLIAAVAERGDRDAFGKLFAHFAPRVKAFMIRNGASPEQAEEIAQEALLLVWRKAALFDPATAGAAAWIFTIARNLRIDAIRKGRGIVPLDEAALAQRADGAASPEAVVQLRQDRDRVLRALAALPGEQLSVIRESYYDEKSHSEIAAAGELPVGTVKSRLRLAMQRLRTVLDDDT